MACCSACTARWRWSDDDDGEGPLIAAVRELVGPDMPIVAPLDLHTNLSDEMMEEATPSSATRNIRTPTCRRPARRRCRSCVATIKGEIKPTMAHTRAAADRAEPVDGHDLAIAAEDRDRPGARRWSRSRASSRRPCSAASPSPMCPSPASRRSLSPTTTRRWPSATPTSWRASAGSGASDFTIHPTPIADAIAEAMAGAAGQRLRPGRHLRFRRERHGRRWHGGAARAARGEARSAAVAQIMDAAAVAACIAAGVGSDGHAQRRRQARRPARRAGRGDRHGAPDPRGQFPARRADGRGHASPVGAGRSCWRSAVRAASNCN